MPELSPHVALLLIDIHIPSSDSLKTKRMVLKSIKDRIRPRFNVSIAEVDYWDKWQRTLLGICMIGSEKKHLESSLQGISSFLESLRNIEINETRLEFL